MKYASLVVFLSAGLMAPAYGQKFPTAIGPVTTNRFIANNRSGNMYHTALRTTAAKQILNARFIYTEEVRQASQMYQNISRLSLSNARQQALRKDIQENIINHTLRTNLLAHLDKNNKEAMLNDLAEYYHLLPKYIPTFNASTNPAETFAWDAISYLRTNPHKPNWALRQVLRTPEVDVTLKQQIKKLLAKNAIPTQGIEEDVNALRKAYEQYTQTLASAQKDPSVEETINIYKQLGEELTMFATLHGRAPLWEVEEERDLYNRFETLLYQNRSNEFELIMPYLEKLYIFAENFPSARLDEATTLLDLEHFVKKYGELPQGVRLRDLMNQRPSEAFLYELMVYWKRHSSTFQDKINKWTFPQIEDPTYPSYY